MPAVCPIPRGHECVSKTPAKHLTTCTHCTAWGSSSPRIMHVAHRPASLPRCCCFPSLLPKNRTGRRLFYLLLPSFLCTEAVCPGVSAGAISYCKDAGTSSARTLVLLLLLSLTRPDCRGRFIWGQLLLWLCQLAVITGNCARIDPRPQLCRLRVPAN